MQDQQLEPLWDEGISGLLEGEYERLQKPLTMTDLRSYANEHAVRIGDILEMRRPLMRSMQKAVWKKPT